MKFASGKFLLHNVNMRSDKNITLGALIKRKRTNLKLTQEKLAERIGVTAATISLYESGERKPELDRIKKLSVTLGVSVIEMLDIEIPDADLDIALRAKDLSREDIEKVKEYIKAIKYVRKYQEKSE